MKIRNDSNDSNVAAMDDLANRLEQDMNHYLTAVASEYYPDTDRMLFMTGFGGDGFKKVYFCPLRSRPVSESVDADDLIVNQSAIDIRNAQRVTHKAMMKPSTVKRLQIMGVYRDVDLGDALMPEQDALQEEEKAQQGLQNDSMRLAAASRARDIRVLLRVGYQGIRAQAQGERDRPCDSLHRHD